MWVKNTQNINIFKKSEIQFAMFTVQELIDIFKNAKRNNTTPELSVLSDIINNVEIYSGVEDNGVDYYFKIKLSELSQSEISDKTIYEMVENGWVLSKDKKYIENFYQ